MSSLLIPPTYVKYQGPSKATYNPASAHHLTPRKKRYFQRKYTGSTFSFYDKKKSLTKSVYQRTYGARRRRRSRRASTPTTQSTFQLPSKPIAGASTASFARRPDRSGRRHEASVSDASSLAGATTQHIADRSTNARRGVPAVSADAPRDRSRTSRRKNVTDDPLNDPTHYLPSTHHERQRRKRAPRTARPTTANPILQGSEDYDTAFRPSCRMYNRRAGDTSSQVSARKSVSRRKRIVHSSMDRTNTETKQVISNEFSQGPNRVTDHYSRRDAEKKGYEAALYASVQRIHAENAARYQYYRQRKNGRSSLMDKPQYWAKPSVTGGARATAAEPDVQ